MQIQAPILKGSAEIRVIDSLTGEVKQVIRKTNVIPNWIFTNYLESISPNALLNPYYNSFRFTKISIATQTATPNVGRWKVDGIQATGFVASGVTTPTYTELVSPPYWQLQNRINFIGSSRTFNTVCLSTTLASNDNWTTAQNNVDVAAWLLLDTPCTQGPTDILDIFYRIQLIDTNQYVRIGSEGAVDCYRAMVGWTRQDRPYSDNDLRGNYAPAHLCAGPVSKVSSSYPYINISNTDTNEYGYLANTSGSPGTINPYTVTARRALYKRRHNLDLNASTEIGRIINGVTYGKLDPYHYLPDGDNTLHTLAWTIDEATPSTNVVQAKYSHSSAATLPMQDNQNLATGSGIFTFTGTTGTWANPYPQIWEPEIITTGDVGTATYTLKVRNFFGQQGNAWTDRAVFNPYFSPTRSIRAGGHGGAGRKAIRFNSRTVIQWDATGITVVDIMNGAYINLDATTTPALAVTNVGQVEVNPANGEIWIGCRSTGLYKVALTGGLTPTYSGATVTRMTTVACYGVDVGRNGRVYALLEGRLANSDDFSVALPFTFTTISDSNWDKVVLLKVDPEHVEDRLGIAVWYPSTTTASNSGNSNKSKIVWWSQTAGAVTGSWTFSTIRINVPAQGWDTYNNFFNVSDTSSIWIVSWYDTSANFNAHAPTWGTTQVDTGTRIGPAGSFDYIIPYNSVYFDKNLVVGRLTAWDADGTAAQDNHRALDFGYRFVYMSKGVGHFGNVLHSIWNHSNKVNGTSGTAIARNPLLWDYYEWNGSAWVIRDWSWNASTNTWTQASAVGAKTTHTSTDSIPNGLTLSWQTGTSSPHFVSTNYYTQYICKGIFKDVSNTFSHEFSFYSKPIKINQAVNSTIPNSSPYRVIVPKSMLGTSPDTNFAALDNDQTYNHSFTISGYGSPVATIYGNPTSIPGPNEVVVNPSTGALIFNSADAGKTVTGTYTYVTGIQDYPHSSRSFLSTPGLLCGFESDQNVTSSGGLVSAWADVAGSDTQATQVTSSARPSLVTSGGPNGLPYINFGSGKFLSLGPAVNFSDFHRGFTFICVFRQTNTVAGDILFLGNGDNIQCLSVYKDAGVGPLRFRVSLENSFNIADAPTSNIVANQWNTLIVSMMPDQSRFIRVNASAQVTQAGPFTESIMFVSRHIARTRCYIGANGLGNPTMQMDIACLYVMDVGLTSVECSSLEATLKTKYGLTTY